MRRIILLLISLVLLAGVGVGIYFLLRKDPPTGAPDMTLLTESLQRTMESEMGKPSLSENQVELTVPAQELDSELARIKILAERLGGNVAVNLHSGGPDQDLLVEIPEKSVQRFISAVRDRTGLVSPAPPGTGQRTQVVEVELRVAK
jgi:uncharacterized protein YneF (UPF0154 family)